MSNLGFQPGAERLDFPPPLEIAPAYVPGPSPLYIGSFKGLSLNSKIKEWKQGR